jgi:hypothetical protein
MFLHAFYPDDAWSHALRDTTTAEDARDWTLQLEQEENTAQELIIIDAIRRFEEYRPGMEVLEAYLHHHIPNWEWVSSWAGTLAIRL